MTERALIAATLALLGLPTAAHAATRPVQAFDQAVGFAPVWTPSQLSAQPGDTIRWQFEQPGNPNAAGASHDVYLVRPGQPDQRLGASYLGPTVEATVEQEGNYAFYCSIHRDTMRGTIAVAVGQATPVIDPGRPWETPAPPVVTDGGPTPLLNSATPLSTLEDGDTVAPALRLAKLSGTRRLARARVEISEPGTLFARVLRGRTTVSTVRLTVKAGTFTVKVKLPKRRARYRLELWVRDAAKLESQHRRAPLPR